MAFSSHRTRGTMLNDPQREDRMYTTNLPALPLHRLVYELDPRGHPRPDNTSEENGPTWCRISYGSACQGGCVRLVPHAAATRWFAGGVAENAWVERLRRFLGCTQAFALHELGQ